MFRLVCGILFQIGVCLRYMTVAMRSRSLTLVLLACTMFLTVSLLGTSAQLIGGGAIRGRVFGGRTPLIWAEVSAYVDGQLVSKVSTGNGGSYLMFLPVGSVNVTVECPGFVMQSRIVSISEGGTTSLDWYLRKSRLAIPEFSSYGMPALVVILIAFGQLLLRRRRQWSADERTQSDERDR